MSLMSNMGTRRHPHLDEVVQRHSTGLTELREGKNAQLELEIRVPHNQYLANDWLNIWRSAYNRILADYQTWVNSDSDESWVTSVECSVRMIDSTGQADRILQAEYSGHALTRRLGLTKQPLISTIYDGFKVSLSKEIEGDAKQYEQLVPTLVRLRMRVSFQMPSLPDWRIDFTYVASTENSTAIVSFLTDVRKAFLPKIPLTPTNFMEMVQPSPGASPELEIEWLPRDRAPTETDIQDAVRRLRQIVWETQTEGNEYSMVIRWLAKLLDRNLKDRSALKQISNHPVGLGLHTYTKVVYPNLRDYYLTDKADGERAFLVVCPREKWPSLAPKKTQSVATGGNDPAKTSEKLAKLRLARRHLEEETYGGNPESEKALIQTTRQLINELEETINDESDDEKVGHGDSDIDLPSDDDTVSVRLPTKTRKAATKSLPYVSYLVTSTLKEMNVIRSAKISNLSGVSIIDLEYVTLKNGSEGLYAFDMLMFNDEDLTGKPLSERLAALDKVSQILDIEIKTHLKLDTSPETKIKKLIASVESKKKPYHVDGLIFTHNNSAYWKTDSVYKMKPPERLTIDFLMMRAPLQMMNATPYVPQSGYTMYLLFCGINQDNMRKYGLSTADLPHYREMFSSFSGAGRIFPIHFTTPTHKLAYIYYHPNSDGKLRLKSDTPKDELHRHVGEFIWIPNAKTKGPPLLPGMVPWSLVKLRADKDANVEDGLAYGNSYITALDTFNYILHPITYADLLKPPSTDTENNYFVKGKSPIYQPVTNYNNFAKAQPMQQLTGADTVIDLMCGKGQDLFKYVGYRVKNLIYVDQDREALDGLRIRFRDHVTDPRWYVYPPMPEQPGINLHAIEYDLRKDLPKLASRLFTEHMLGVNLADGIVCNLGLHYIIASLADVKNFIKFLDATLRTGGKFIYTGFNGGRVFQMLSGLKKGERWTSDKGKYIIQRNYTENKLDYGLKVSVLHPFSDGELYEENLLPDSLIAAEMGKAGYMLVQQGSFQDFWYRYEQLGRGLAARLSTEDRFYSSIYQYTTFVRVSTA